MQQFCAGAGGFLLLISITKPLEDTSLGYAIATLGWILIATACLISIA